MSEVFGFCKTPKIFVLEEGSLLQKQFVVMSRFSQEANQKVTRSYKERETTLIVDLSLKMYF